MSSFESRGEPTAFTQAVQSWLRSMHEPLAGRALLAIGLNAGELGRARARAQTGAGFRPDALRWALSEEQFRHRSLNPDALAGLVQPGELLRLSVETDAVPSAIVDRLLGVPEVSSAFVAVERPAGALRRRPWRWPYRIGLFGFTESAAEDVATKIRELHLFPDALLDVHRLEEEPGSVDVLVVQGNLRQAVSDLIRLKPVANAVLVLDRPSERWPVVDAELAAARAATSAVASALATPASLPELLANLVYEASHAQPFDVALTTAAQDEVLLAAEPEAMGRAALPEVAIEMATEVSMAARAFEPEAPPELAGADEELRAAARGGFGAEREEASTIARVRERVETAIAARQQERWCQARVGTGGDNVIRAGKNPVSVFIGEREEGALAAGVVDESELPWEEERAESFRLTVLLVPLVPEGEPQQAELDLPRFGRSTDAKFELEVPEESAKTVAARIVVIFRNRVLQTGVLRGRVDERANLEEVTALVPSLQGLDDRRAFDVAMLANHTNGVAALIAHSNDHTFVSALPSFEAFGKQVADELAKAIRVRPTKKGLLSETARKLLVELANIGQDLYGVLAENLAALSTANRIQLVTAHGEWFLPIEILYPRDAPDDDATICARYLEDPATCDGTCTPADDTTSLCPNAFWGLGKTIERQHFNLALDPQPGPYAFLSHDQPRRGRRDLIVKRTVFGASSRVNDKDRDATAAAIRAIATKSWDEWKDALGAEDTQLLVLLPHTDYNKTTLEIANDALRRSRIEEKQVTGDRKVRPVVMLLGCRTTGKVDDPTGFSARFMLKGARVVFQSSTDLLNVHATEFARRLAGELVKPDRKPELLSDVLVTFRRGAVRDGFVAAFAISAYGDADWRL
jgi:hypothetical protein